MLHHNGHTLFGGARIASAAALIAASALVAGTAQATPPNQFVSTLEWEGPFAAIDVKTKYEAWHLKLDAKGATDLVVTRIAIGPGGSSGWHTHPGSSLVTVTEGTITLYDAQLCTGRTLGVGQTFIDEGGGHLHLVRNETAVPAAVGAVQFMPRGIPRRIDAPRPNNCDADVQ